MTQQEQPNQPIPLRLDQRLVQRAQEQLQQLLNEFPELRTVIVVFDYALEDCGSLPQGTWLPRGPLKIEEVISACQAVDRTGIDIRQKHDAALVAEMQKVINANKENSRDGASEG